MVTDNVMFHEDIIMLHLYYKTDYQVAVVLKKIISDCRYTFSFFSIIEFDMNGFETKGLEDFREENSPGIWIPAKYSKGICSANISH